MLSLQTESEPAALSAAPSVKRLDLGCFRAAQDPAKVARKQPRAFPLVALFSRQQCQLLANQLK